MIPLAKTHGTNLFKLVDETGRIFAFVLQRFLPPMPEISI